MNKIILKGNELVKGAGFDYAVCGGYGLDLFAGRELRAHGDFDIVVYKADKRRVVQHFANMGWPVFGRFMESGRAVTQHLFYAIDDINDNYWDDCKNMWAVKQECLTDVLHKLDRLQAKDEPHSDIYTYQTRKWLVQEEIEFVELEIDAKDGEDFVVQENPRITRALDKAILHSDSVPYLAPEIILFYKSDKMSSEHPNVRPKTHGDFRAIVPLLSDESRNWLKAAVGAAYPDGYEWLEGLL